MRKSKILFITMIQTALLMVLASCGKGTSVEDMKLVPTENPYVYVEDSAKSMKKQMTDYLHAKYNGKEFVVTDFYNGGIIDSPHMTAYDAEMTEGDTFSVTVTYSHHLRLTA